VDGFADTLARYNALTAEDIQKFAAAKLTGGKLGVVVVGKASVCEKKLREIYPKLRVVEQGKLGL
jgi:predicted Zn-dependent peptidase